MVMLLESAAGDFEERFSQLLAAKREVSEDVDATVRGIIDDVRARGDEALIELTERFDHVDLRAQGIRVSDDEIDEAVGLVDTETYQALEFAHQRITAHHQRQVPRDDFYQDSTGAEPGSRWTASNCENRSSKSPAAHCGLTAYWECRLKAWNRGRKAPCLSFLPCSLKKVTSPRGTSRLYSREAPRFAFMWNA